ncbi:MAG TPA: sugar transferase [Anaerolineae bacterium]|nr:sugar transferase [Anaerolineae bacterium]
MALASLKRPGRLLQIAVDAVLVNLGFAVAYWVRYQLQWPWPVAAENKIPYATYVPMEAILALLLLVVYGMQRVYTPQRGRSWIDESFALLSGTATGVMLMIVLTYFLPDLSYSRGLLPLAAMTMLVLLIVSRIAKSIIVSRMRRKGIGIKQVLIVGAGEVGRTVMRTIVARPGLGYRLVGFVDDDPSKGQTDLGRIKALGSIDNLPTVISTLNIDMVIVTLPWMYQRKILRIVRQCERHRVQAYIVPDLLQITISQVGIETLGEVPMIGMREEAISHGWRVVKRIVDIAGSLTALIAGAPFALVVALLVKLGSKGPIIFQQIRLGEREKPFTCYKFRTMRQNAEAEKAALMEETNGDKRLFKMKDDPRITPLGRLLRKFRIDEYPQFFNVLRGDMSIVGPRPPVPIEVENYLEWHRHKLDVPAGITGLAQVSGGSDLSFDEWALLDTWYAENWTFLLDLKIMLKTVGVILIGHGAY